MNFYKMSSWANYPNIDPHHQIVLTTSRELNIPSNQFVEINLGLILLTLPKNYIIKISNPQKNFKIISEFWLPSYNELTLSVVTKKALCIKVGEILCHLQLLPVQIFLPGNPSPASNKFPNIIQIFFQF